MTVEGFPWHTPVTILRTARIYFMYAASGVDRHKA